MSNQNNFYSQKGQQKNSYITLMEQISLLNKNSIEIISKFNEALSSKSSSVSVKMLNQDGTYSTYEMPTIGEFKTQIDVANTNIKRLAGLEQSTFIFDGKSSKKIFAVDVNREPSPISTIDSFTQFQQNNNWFFESLMNPTLSVKINLGDKVDDNVDAVMSRRYIPKFEADENGYTTEGLKSLNDFKSKFLNRTDISIQEFETWLTNPTNIGVLNNTDLEANKDDQIFPLSLRTLSYKGTFSVIKSESDTLNNKLWYHLDTLKYYTNDGRSRFLAIDDQLVINSKNSTTRYKVVEISTASSMNRISVQRIEGYDPIPIGANVLEYYSDLVNDKNVKVTIGFNEYNIIFVKPINTETMILGSTWSKGSSFYTNDLVLDTDNNLNLLDFYFKTVYDYGRLLKDLVKKQIPSEVGVKPFSPQVAADNFKVVQINQHLTDTKNEDELRELHSRKTSIKSTLSEINTSITDKSRELNTKTYRNVAEKTKAKNEFDKLVTEQASQTKLYSSVVSQITNSKVDSKNVDKKYRVRGFWAFPEPRVVEGYTPQQVIGFEYQYRYSSKTGKETPVNVFVQPANLQNTDGSTSTTVPSNSNGATMIPSKSGYFSNWIPVKTDIRKRTFNSATEEWNWVVEDISDADTPNINQIDIPININEKVDIRIRSISEVGYPDSILYSDWSNTVVVSFPDELDDVLDENSFILKEANQEEIKVQFANDLAAMGVVKHIEEQFYSENEFYAHTDRSIATSFKDTFGKPINLRDYITSLTNRITILEEQVNRAKGNLSVSLFMNTEETILSPNSETTISVECEDYGEKSGTTRTYYNSLYVIKDYYLKFSNIAAENDLGLLSNRLYLPTVLESTNTFYNDVDNKAVIVDDNDKMITQNDYQFIWFSDNYSLSTDKIYKYASGETENDYYNVLTTNYNIGYSGNYTANASIITDVFWSGITLSGNTFAATVHPVVSNISNIVEEGQSKLKLLNATKYFTIPINIYFKYSWNSTTALYVVPFNTTQTSVLTKYLKVFIEPESSSRPVEFKLKFTLKRNKTSTYNVGQQVQSTVYGGGGSTS